MGRALILTLPAFRLAGRSKINRSGDLFIHDNNLYGGLLSVKEVAMHLIYALVDPRTDVVAYVGITNNPNQRLQEHVEMKADNEKKNAWVQQLPTEQVVPKMKSL